jgi:hypothetical protein
MIFGVDLNLFQRFLMSKKQHPKNKKQAIIKQNIYRSPYSWHVCPRRAKNENWVGQKSQDDYPKFAAYNAH